MKKQQNSECTIYDYSKQVCGSECQEFFTFDEGRHGPGKKYEAKLLLVNGFGNSCLIGPIMRQSRLLLAKCSKRSTHPEDLGFICKKSMYFVTLRESYSV